MPGCSSRSGLRLPCAQPRAARERFVDFALRRARLDGCSALLGSPPVRRTARVVLSTPRNASLTEASDGNASATSGSRSTMLLPSSRRRRQCLPRTPPFIVEKSYSGRRSWSTLSLFFIEVPLAQSRFPSADDSNCSGDFAIGHHKKAAQYGHPDRDEPTFRDRMLVVRKRRRERVIEDRRSLDGARTSQRYDPLRGFGKVRKTCATYEVIRVSWAFPVLGR